MFMKVHSVFTKVHSRGAVVPGAVFEAAEHIAPRGDVLGRRLTLVAF